MIITAEELKRELDGLNLPVAYGRFEEPQPLPYIVYMGNGQEAMGADNTLYYKGNTYRVEYYYRLKNEATEEAIENTFLQEGWLYTKSEDVYIEDQDVFVIYYYL